MPNPTQSDLHVNVPLTNISVAYIQDTDLFIADRVFPRIPVQHQSNAYWRYYKGEWRRTEVQKRAPGTESAGVGWNVKRETYFCDVFAVHKDVDDQTRSNADSAFNLDREATEFVTQQMLLQKDKDWAAAYFAASVWDTDISGVASGETPGTSVRHWDDDANSDPIVDVNREQVRLRRETGFAPNTLVLGADVWNTLRNHSDLIERIKYTQRGFVSTDLIASAFDVDRLLVAWATENTSEENQDPDDTETNASYSFVNNSKDALLVYSNPRPSLMTPSGGYTFTWNGYLAGNSQGIRIKRFRQEAIASDRIEAEMTYDQKVVSTDVGVFFDGVVS